MIDKRIVLCVLLLASAGRGAVADPLATPPPEAASTSIPCTTGTGHVQLFSSSMSISHGNFDMRQMLDDQRSMRAELLTVLSPAHRSLLAQIIGELAIAAQPDLAGEAARIDAALTRSEADGIMRVERDREVLMARRFEAMAAASGHPMPMPMPIMGAAGAPPVMRAGSPAAGTDVGSVIVRAVATGMLMPPATTILPGPPQH